MQRNKLQAEQKMHLEYIGTREVGWFYDVIALRTLEPIRYATASFHIDLLGAPASKRLLLVLDKNVKVDVRFPFWKRQKTSYRIEEVARLAGLVERFVSDDRK
jgi:hypothetical protein